MEIGPAAWEAIGPKEILKFRKLGLEKSSIDMEIGPAAQEALGPKEQLKFRKLGPGKSRIGRSNPFEPIQDHHFFPACNPGHGN